MIRYLKVRPSKSHTKTSQQVRPAIQKPTEILDINTKVSWKTTNSFNIRLPATVWKMNSINIKNEGIPKTNFSQIASDGPIPIDIILR